MRNSRLSLDGKVAPEIDYFLQLDLCDQGTFKPLDFYVRLQVATGLRVQAGQFRVPFGVETFRGPHTYLFANRSFIGKQICNYRAVGCKLSYQLPKLPLLLEAGVFNSSAITLHTVWSKKLAYAAKATYTLGEVKFSTGFMTIAPDNVRANFTGLRWSGHPSAGLWKANICTSTIQARCTTRATAIVCSAVIACL